MSEAKHTPEPWKLIEAGNALGIVPAKRPKGVSAREVEDIAALSLVDDQHDGRANARRICAAVNATAGIPTEALEHGVVAELLAASQAAYPCLEKPLVNAAELTALRLLRVAIARATGKAVQP